MNKFELTYRIIRYIVKYNIRSRSLIRWIFAFSGEIEEYYYSHAVTFDYSVDWVIDEFIK